MQLHDTIEHAESRAWNSQDSYTATGEHQGLLQAPPPPPHHAGWQSRSSSRAGCTRWETLPPPVSPPFYQNCDLVIQETCELGNRFIVHAYRYLYIVNSKGWLKFKAKLADRFY